MNYTLDACAVICAVNKEEGYEVIEGLFVKAFAEEVNLFMSYINYGEVLYQLLLDRSKPSIIEAEKIFEGFPIKLIQADLDTVRLASIYKSKGGISYADCFALATAKKYKSKLVTSDREFKKFEKEVSIMWVR